MMWLFSLGPSLDFVDSLASYASNRFQVVGIRQQRHASGELTSAQLAGLAMHSLLDFSSHCLRHPSDRCTEFSYQAMRSSRHLY
jgi:hypothetical protein